MNSDSNAREYLKGLTVLYVEDDDDTREQFSKFLTRIAGTVIIAKNGAEGLAAYHAHHPRIIITDIQMPVMDGLGMTREIRKSDTSACIIVLTAYEQVDYLKTSINVGVTRYVTKPVDGMTLHETLLECAHSLMAEDALKNAAFTDPLTGLLNRRETIHRFNSEKSASERHGTPLSIIIADIDHFKKINDSFGHNAGDKILKSVADTLSSLIRSEDICGRWGGEEFLLILPRIYVKAAAMVAEKLRLAVSRQATEWQGDMLTVTISLGVGAFKPGKDLESCIHLADAALYRSKANGRNRYTIAEDADAP